MRNLFFSWWLFFPNVLWTTMALLVVPQPSTTTTTTTRRFMVSTESSDKKSGKSKTQPKKNDHKKNKTKNNNKTNNHKRSSPPLPVFHREPRDEDFGVLNDFEENTSVAVQLARRDDVIGCEHFGTCPGCVVNDQVHAVDMIQRAKQYFSSTMIKRNRYQHQQYLLQQQQQQEGRRRPRNNNNNNNQRDEYAHQLFNSQDDDDENGNDGFYQVVIPSQVTQWRTQAKLVVAPKSSAWAKDGCRFGLYQRNSHDVLDIPHCQVHHPSINAAVAALERATQKVQTPAYVSPQDAGTYKQQNNRNDGGSFTGGLRYIQLQVERTTGHVCCTLVWAASDLKRTQPILSRLVKEMLLADNNVTWHSIWCHTNDSPGNAIFSRNMRNWHCMWKKTATDEFIKEPIPSSQYGWLYFTPSTFRQGNMEGFDIIAHQVAKHVPPYSKVCELYAGVGVLGLTTLMHHHHHHHDNDNDSTAEGDSNTPLTWLRCSDENPTNSKCFARSVSSIPKSIVEYPESKQSRGKNNNNKYNAKKGEETMTLGELAQQMDASGFFDVNNQQQQEPQQQRVGRKTSYMVADAETALKRGQALGANVLIVDPPRKGLEDGVLYELCKPINPKQEMVESPDLLPYIMNSRFQYEDDEAMEMDENIHWTNDVTKLIYVSCGFDALARDCEKLLSSPAGWMLESATGYVLFPGSNHVETLCIFTRRGGGGGPTPPHRP